MSYIYKRLAMYIYEKRQIGLFSICLNLLILNCMRVQILAKGKQPFYIYGFELLKTALQIAKNLGNTEAFSGYIFFVSI